MARTRKDVRLTRLIQARENLLQSALDMMDESVGDICYRYVQLMGEHLRDIGLLTPSDVHRLEQLRRMNYNVKAVEKLISAKLPRTLQDLYSIYSKIAKYDTRIAGLMFGRDYTTVSKNIGLKRILKAAWEETRGTLKNLSNTTVVNTAYKEAVDTAVWAVRSGVEDYNSAIRRSMNNAASYGLRVREKDNAKVVDYESGYSRRLDSAVRMNVLDGARHLNQTVMKQVGETFGADGVEIDAHMLCADDHLPYQGKQFSNAQFEKIQDGLERPFGEWNCRHTWSPILLGISQPRYSEEELEEMERNSTEKVTIDGVTKTRYEWSQSMRATETAIRRAKDTANICKAAGDDEGRERQQGKINRLQSWYGKIASGSGIKPQYDRQNVRGFRDAKLTGGKIMSNKTTGDSKERERLRSKYSTEVPLKALDAPGYIEKFNTITENDAVNQSVYECAVQALSHRSGTNGEDLYLIDGNTGKILHSNTTSTVSNAVTYTHETIDTIRKARVDGIPIIALHNHPNGMPPSLDDGSSAVAHDYDMGIVVGHNLEVFTYTKTDRMYTTEQCAAIHEKLVKAVQFEFDFEEEIWYNGLKRFGMEIKRK